MSFEQRERERTLAYIDAQLATGKRDKADMAALKKRRAEIVREAEQRPGFVGNVRDRMRTMRGRAEVREEIEAERATPVTSDAKQIAERMAKAARGAAEEVA